MNKHLVQVARCSIYSVIRVFTCAILTLSVQAKETEVFKYPIPEHGIMQMQVPAEWYARYHAQSRYPYPFIIMYPHETEPQFQLSISIFWEDRIGEKLVTDKAYIMDMVQDIGEGLLPGSEEDTLELIKIDGSMGQGYFFDLSDASENAGDFPFLRQGAIAVGELLMVFAFLYADKDSSDLSRLDQMLKTTIQIHSRHVRWFKNNHKQS